MFQPILLCLIIFIHQHQGGLTSLRKDDICTEEIKYLIKYVKCCPEFFY